MLPTLAAFSLATAQQRGQGWGSGTFGGRTGTGDTVCAMDMLTCPDGSMVSRNSDSNCDFDDCDCETNPLDADFDIMCILGQAQASVFDLFTDSLSDITLDPTSLTEFLWDGLSWEDVLESTADTLLKEWMEAISLDTLLDGVESSLETLQSEFVLDGLSQQEIFDAISNSTQWNNLVDTMSWEDGLDFGSFADSLENVVNDLKMSDIPLPEPIQSAVETLATELVNFGFNDLLNLATYDQLIKDAWTALQGQVTDIPDAIATSVNTLISDFELYESGDASVTIGGLISDIQDAESQIQDLINGGGADAAWGVFETVLESADWGLGQWNVFSNESNLLVDLAGNLESVLNMAQYVPTGLSSDDFSLDWLNTYIGSLQDIIRVDEDRVPECSDTNVRDLVWQKNWQTSGIWAKTQAYYNYASNCFDLSISINQVASLMNGNLEGAQVWEPNCDCWKELYTDAATMSALECTINDDRSESVAARIAECNGDTTTYANEATDQSLLDSALEGFTSLTSNLLDFESALDGSWIPDIDLGTIGGATGLIGSFAGIQNAIDAIQGLSLDTSTLSGYIDSVQDWDVDMNGLLDGITFLEGLTNGDLDGLNINGIRDAINGAVDGLAAFNGGDTPTARPVPDPRSNTDDGSSFPTWAWVVVGCFLVLMVIMAGWQCTKKKNLENGIAVEGEEWPQDELPEGGINLDDGEREYQPVATGPVQVQVNGTQVTSGEMDGEIL